MQALLTEVSDESGSDDVFCPFGVRDRVVGVDLADGTVSHSTRKADESGPSRTHHKPHGLVG